MANGNSVGLQDAPAQLAVPRLFGVEAIFQAIGYRSGTSVAISVVPGLHVGVTRATAGAVLHSETLGGVAGAPFCYPVNGNGEVRVSARDPLTNFSATTLGWKPPRSLKPNPASIVFGGDSLPHGYNIVPQSQCFPALIGAAKNFWAVVNAGVPANYASDLLARWDADVLAHLPAIAAFMIGANDSGSLRPLGDFAFEVREIVCRTKRAGIKPVIFTPPVNLDPVYQSRMPPYVNVLRQVATDTPGVGLIDVFELFSGYTQAELAVRIAPEPDGTHLLALGHQSIRDYALLPSNAAAFA
jgi:acyl-CoA thioesterase-1